MRYSTKQILMDAGDDVRITFIIPNMDGTPKRSVSGYWFEDHVLAFVADFPFSTWEYREDLSYPISKIYVW